MWIFAILLGQGFCSEDAVRAAETDQREYLEELCRAHDDFDSAKPNADQH